MTPDPCHYAGSDPELYMMQGVSDTSSAELLIGGTLKHWLDIPMTQDERAELQHHDAYLVVRCFASGQREVVIERELN
eukprot:8895693-Heterocapsa_arctica.AAC.1